ncbi:MAG: HEAT repeat domain-containing protein [Nannocystaceae bacterium]
MEALRSEIDRELRRAASGDYNAKLDGLASAAWAAQRLARGLTPAQAKAARATLRQVLEMPLMGSCTPMCCNASFVRAQTIAAKFACLQAWGSRDPEAAEELPAAVIDALLVPYSRRLALAAAELFARAPRASARHLPSLLRALEEHPRWQVRDALARALGRAALGGPPSQRLLRALDQAAADDEPQLQRTATKALAALAARAKKGA